MAFLNPLLLIGMTAIAAPIIIHLFMNRRVKKMVWAAMRFLENSVVKNQKRMNLEDLVLLMLRCLLLILLALALARPIIGGGPGGGAAGKGAQTAVIALDNSYSMGQSDGGPARLDEARKAAEQVLDSLPGGSSVTVLLFSDRVEAAVAEPTYDLNLARKVIRGAKLSSRPTNVQPVVTQAMETLTRKGGSGASLTIVTDGQASGWGPMEEIRKALANPAITSRLILVGEPEEHNLAVSDLRMASAIAAVGTAAQFEAEVSNFGTEDARAVAVKLSIDREPPTDEGAIETIPAGAAKRLSLYAKFRTPGYHTVTARIDPDHLPADDQRTIALRAVDDVRVLLVDGDPGTEPRAAETFYLRNALTPVQPSERERYYVKTKTIAPADLTSTKLTEYEAVVLANVAKLAPTAVEGLTAYLRHGGGLIIFPGDKTDAAFYNETFGQKLLLPASLGEIRGETDQYENPFALQSKNYTNHIATLWNDPGAGSLGTVQFFRAFELTPLPGHNAEAGEPEVVLKYADGKPAVMERSWGRGRVILFSSTADTDWNDFGLRPAFVPLMARTLGAILDQQDARLNLPVGGKFELVCDPEWSDRDAIIIAPGESKESGSLRRIGMAAGLPVLQFEETGQAGAYEVLVKTEPPSTVKFATQFDASESNLRALSKEQLEALAPATQVLRWTGHGTLDLKGGKGGGGGSEWWRALAFMALIVACVEVGLAAVFSASK